MSNVLIPAPDSYPVYSVVGDRYTFLLTGAQTGGAYSVFEFYVPAGSGPPPHVHSREDEAFYVVEGEFEFTVASEPVRLTAGQSIFAKRDIPHNFRNVGNTPGRMIVTITPAGIEDFFVEVGTRLESREAAPIAPTEEAIALLKGAIPKYGMQLAIPPPQSA